MLTPGFLTPSTHEWHFQNSSDIICETKAQTGKQGLDRFTSTQHQTTEAS